MAFCYRLVRLDYLLDRLYQNVSDTVNPRLKTVILMF
jgi:hypothetical protein